MQPDQKNPALAPSAAPLGSPSVSPVVSIVTPCFNMGRFLEETIQSVLEQDYPNIEYIVVDGGSTDGTLEILKRYESRLQYISEADKGQTDAVNKGFGLTSGSIFTFLNADDTLLPGAIRAVVRAFADNPGAAVIYGNAWHVAEDGAHISRYPVEPYDPANLARRCFICQPAAFIRRKVFAEIGMLDVEQHYALDYDLWIRIAQRYPQPDSMKMIDMDIATSRLHAASKTVGQMAPAMRATIELLRRHYGYVPFHWLYGYWHHRLSGQELVLERPRPSLKSACVSIAWGVRYNWRSPLRYCSNILGAAAVGLTSNKRS
jgi:glycosyltransferase involved in cell wall biosynthesis